MPVMSPEITYDVFISYNSQDRVWVRSELLPRLERAGLKVCIDYCDFRIGASIVSEIERALLGSRHVIAVLTPAYLDGAWTDFEALMVTTLDPGSRKARLLPLLLKPCKLPIHFNYLIHADFAAPDDLALSWRRLLDALVVPTGSDVQGAAPATVNQNGLRDIQTPVKLSNLDWFRAPTNPFGDTLVIREAERFIGREAELRRLQAYLVRGSVALQGEAKIGKSSLLWRLQSAWQGAVIGPLDCQEIENRHDFYACLAEALGIDESGWQAIRRALKAQTCLLMLDELDVGPSIGLSYEDLARFRGVCSNHAGLKIVTVSRRPLKEVFPDPGRGSEAYNFLVPLTLGLMSDDESRRLLAHPWAPDALQFEPAIRDELLRLAGGHPFKLHRAAFHRYETLSDSSYDWQAAYRQDLEHML